jgi:hypothetical protein
MGSGDGGTAFLQVALGDCSFEYADDRAHPELLKFSSGIRITFPSGAVLVLMESK